jgi:EAL domain-containing protein (putative c-di-GMP-specific phosphodiesterase class I)
VATVSFNPQQVSAATESGVNPKNRQLLEANWLELWYQPKIDSQTLSISGAEALVRMRDPHLGIVQPAHFLPEDGDPRFQALSQFVIDQAVADWHNLLADGCRVDISINVPVSFLRDPACLDYLYRRLPDHPDFDGIIVEVNGTEVTRSLSLVAELAKQMRLRKIGISVDDLGMEWPDLAGLEEFPFVEIKADRAFVAGCAHDRLKRNVCRQIVDLASHYGARAVAEGVETQADFIVARDLGFDLIQGFLFARPMDLRQFTRTMTSQPVTMLRADGPLIVANAE